MLTREEILARKTGRATYKLSDGSGEVGLKGLTHTQALEVSEVRQGGDIGRSTELILHYGMTQPQMSMADVAAWRAEDDAGVIEELANEIGRLSGMVEGAGKSRVPGAGQ